MPTDHDDNWEEHDGNHDRADRANEPSSSASVVGTSPSASSLRHQASFEPTHGDEHPYQLYDEVLVRLERTEVRAAERDMMILKLTARTHDLELQSRKWNAALHSQQCTAESKDRKPSVVVKKQQIVAIEKGVSTIEIQDAYRKDKATQTSDSVEAEMHSAGVQTVNIRRDAGVEAACDTVSVGLQTDVPRSSLGVITNVVDSGDDYMTNIASTCAVVERHPDADAAIPRKTAATQTEERPVLKNSAVSFADALLCAEYDQDESIDAAPIVPFTGSILGRQRGNIANAKKRARHDAPASIRVEDAASKRRRDWKAGVDEREGSQYHAASDGHWLLEGRDDAFTPLTDDSATSNDTQDRLAQHVSLLVSPYDAIPSYSDDGSESEMRIIQQFLQTLHNLQTLRLYKPVPLMFAMEEMEKSAPNFVQRLGCASVVEFVQLVKRKSDLRYTGSVAAGTASVYLDSLTSTAVPLPAASQSTKPLRSAAAQPAVVPLPPPLCRNIR